MKSKTNVSILDNIGLRRKADIEIGDNGSYESGLLVDKNAVEKMIGEKDDSYIDNGTSGIVKHIEVLTQAQYDALATKDVNTEYNIIESI